MAENYPENHREYQYFKSLNNSFQGAYIQAFYYKNLAEIRFLHLYYVEYRLAIAYKNLIPGFSEILIL